ncbi:MAG: acyl-CoA thioesterase domain-containing protein [Actinomycetes bacterium]
MAGSGAPTGDASSYYLVDGDRVVPTVLTESSWDRSTQQGPPVCGLLGWATTGIPTLTPMQAVRLTIDLWRPVPRRALRVERSVRREGKRMQVVDVGLFDGEVEVTHATALRVRVVEPGWPEVEVDPARPPVAVPPVPDAVVAGTVVGHPMGDPTLGPDEAPAGFLRSMDGVRVGGATGDGDPVVLWARMSQPLVAGEPTPPVALAAWAADFASGLASTLDAREWTYLNPDVNLHLLREPVGEWIAVSGLTWAGVNGIGHGRATLHDRTSLVGTATAGQLVDRRG